MPAQPFPHRLDLAIPLPTPQLATVAAQALAVDQDLNADQVQTVYTADGSCLCVSLSAANVRILRIATNAMFDMLLMVTNTMADFADESPTAVAAA
ncbi:hypothetical protein H4R34_005071 [Dimargaris verticillata]|uniref:CTAG/Pcc1 family n=1 Tax=Dimargaris verticillata TaxID=2761393 RepID=A0A9W8AXP7_9FUNG|nr:hypothetical protein H4R34_005071 [Dimargaris verticillata]